MGGGCGLGRGYGVLVVSGKEVVFVIGGLYHTARSLEAWSVTGGHVIVVCALVMGCHRRRAA
jgi:hypothetical protein